jgi:hypothetical protein
MVHGSAVITATILLIWTVPFGQNPLQHGAPLSVCVRDLDENFGISIDWHWQSQTLWFKPTGMVNDYFIDQVGVAHSFLGCCLLLQEKTSKPEGRHLIMQAPKNSRTTHNFAGDPNMICGGRMIRTCFLS